MDFEDQDYEDIRRQLERAVGRSCPAWLADRRDDIVQAALIRVLDVVRKSAERRTFTRSYLWRTAFSALIDEIRRLQRRREAPLEAVGEAPVSPQPGPERRAAGRQAGRGIARCLGRMAAPRRHAVTLYLLGHTVPEIGELLGWSAKRADNLVYRGLADLRQCLVESGVRL